MDKLTEIMAHKRREIEPRLRPIYPHELERLREKVPANRRFKQRLAKKGRLSVIAEIKRKSPSAGDIAAMADAVEQARIYYNAGVDAISVLTDEKYFNGKLQDLWDVTDLLSPREDGTPCLRKDFFVHPVQVVEAAEAGARAILIIVRALSDDEMKALRKAADMAGLDSLYEVHTEAELEQALKHSPEIVGVNNRDLSRFVTDVGISERIIPQIPQGIVSVCESGIFTAEDAQRAKACGADAILVGQALMEAEDVDDLVEVFQKG